MIIIYECSESIEEYARKAKENEFPEMEQCPSCKGRESLRRHGFYQRHAVEEGNEYQVFICRLRCKGCKKTVSLLPDLLIPYFQYTLKSVFHQIKKRTRGEGKGEGIRQRIHFYWQRFMSHLQRIELFFRGQGWREKRPEGQKEKAIKCVEMIEAFGEAPFLRRISGHFINNSMAHSVYHVWRH